MIPHVSLSPLPSNFPAEKPSSDNVLKLLSAEQTSVEDKLMILSNWSHISRSSEINQSLLHILLHVTSSIASQILLQLLKPCATLRNVDIGEFFDKSLVVNALLLSPDGLINTSDAHILVDCGASGLGYISNSFVDLHNLPCVPLPYNIPIYNVDGSQNIAGSIKRLCTMDMQIGGHKERITFRVTETGSSNIILGLDWLRLHDPLINWSKGKLLFINCPSSSSNCSGHTSPHPPEDSGPDSDHLRSVFDCNTSEEIKLEWYNAIQTELGAEDEAILCIDLNAGFSPPTPHPKDTRIPEHLRKSKDHTVGIERYLKDFAPVFSQSGFDELPPR